MKSCFDETLHIFKYNIHNVLLNLTKYLVFHVFQCRELVVFLFFDV